MAAKMQRLEVVRGQSEFLSHFSLPQANPNLQTRQPAGGTVPLPVPCTRPYGITGWVGFARGIEK